MRLIYSCMVVLLLTFFSMRTFSSSDLAPADISYLEGNKAYKEGRIQNAIKSYQDAIRLKPDHYYAWTNLGTLLLRNEQIPEAVNAFRAAYALQPNNVKANYNYGVSLHQNNDLDNAIEFYKKALRLDTNHVNCYYNLGLIYQEKGDLSTAAEFYGEAATLDPSHVEARLNYCNILMASDDLAAAEECYIAVLRIEPSYVRCLVNLASLYVNLGVAPYLQRAADLYAAALQIDPANRMARHGLQALRQPDLGQDAGDSSTSLRTADPEYVRELFDSYSFHFEKSLSMLNYTSHLLVAELLLRIRPAPAAAPAAEPLRILDLGAGTGLFCDALRNLSATSGPGGPPQSLAADVTAVDISSKMLAKARAKSCYRRIVCADITSFLADEGGGESAESYGAIVLVDVLVYFGDIHSVLQLSRALLSPGGVVIFTAENLAPPPPDAASSPAAEAEERAVVDVDAQGDQVRMAAAGTDTLPYALQKSGRFGHSREYIHEVAGQVGLQVQLLEDCTPRSDSGVPVRGLVVVLGHPDPAPSHVLDSFAGY